MTYFSYHPIFKLRLLGLLSFLFIVLLSGCEDKSPSAKSTDKLIKTFSFEASKNDALTADAVGVINGTAITVTVPISSVTALVPTITHDGASISPASGVAQDFSSAVTYTVTAEDGSTQAYTVTVVMSTPTSKSITSFFFLANDNSSIEQDIEGTVGSSTIAVRLPAGVSRAALVPKIAHNGASISPLSGTSQDFTNPVTYTVTAGDDSEQEYVVTVTEATPASKRLLTFSFLASKNILLKADLEVMVGETETAITVMVPTTGVTALVPTITHDGASVSPASLAPQDFTNPVTYTVTADDASTQAYTVTVTSEDNFVAIPNAVFRGKLKALSTLSSDVFNANDMLNANHVDVQTLATLDVSNSNETPYDSPDRIASLQGLEHFVSLRSLDCSINSLTALDMSNNTALQSLDCSSNRLPALDMSKNTALQTLNCSGNFSLTTLNVSNNTALQTLDCSVNGLTTLDVSNNTALQTLDCIINSLTTLDVSNNTALQTLSCRANRLTALDVSNNTALQTLSCPDNSLTTLDVSNNTALQSLNCFDNSLTALDVSNHILLQTLGCGENNLTSVDVSNNPALRRLECGKTGISTLDLSNNTSLQYLQCPNTGLTTLNLSSHPALETLYCYANSSLTTLNISGATALKSMTCFFSRLVTLDLSLNLLLDSLNCNGISTLETLDIRHFTATDKLGLDDRSTGALTSLTVNDAIKDDDLIAAAKTDRCNELTIQVFGNGSITDTDYRPTGTAATCVAAP